MVVSNRSTSIRCPGSPLEEDELFPVLLVLVVPLWPVQLVWQPDEEGQQSTWSSDACESLWYNWRSLFLDAQEDYGHYGDNQQFSPEALTSGRIWRFLLKSL